MNPTQISAQFAAYTWFFNGNAGRAAADEEASEFARDNWATFLHYSHKGLGRLLIRLASPRRKEYGRLSSKAKTSGRTRAPQRTLEGAAAMRSGVG
jgi:hypothetical protein